MAERLTPVKDHPGATADSAIAGSVTARVQTSAKARPTRRLTGFKLIDLQEVLFGDSFVNFSVTSIVSRQFEHCTRLSEATNPSKEGVRQLLDLGKPEVNNLGNEDLPMPSTESDKPAIAFHYFTFGIGGGEKVTSLLIKCFVEHGYPVTLLTDIPLSENHQELPSSVDCVVLPSAGDARSQLIQDTIAQRNIKVVVYASWLSTKAIQDEAAIQAAGAKFVYFPQSCVAYFVDKPDGQSLLHTMRTCAQSADAVAALGQSDVLFWKTWCPNSFLVTNPVGDYLAQDTTIPHVRGTRTVVWCGRLDPREKRPDLAIEVFSAFHRVRPGYRLVIVGGGDDNVLAGLKDLAAQRGIADAVTFVGWVNDCTPYLVDSDIYIQTSPVEGFCLTLCEAMNVGVPSVCFELPNCEPTRDSGVMQVPWNDIEQFVNALVFLADCSDNTYSSISKQEYQRVRELCDKDIYGEWHHVLAAALAQASADGDKVDDTQTRLMESLAGGYTRLADETARATQRCHELANDVERQSNDLREKDSRIQELEGELAAERAKVARFDTSISFKIGRAVTAPPRFIRDHLARHR